MRHPSLLAVALLLATAIASRGQSVSLTPLIDTSLYSESGSLANGAGDGLYVGHTVTDNLRRALLEFDVAGAVPAGATITGATLTLHLVQTNIDSTAISLHRVTASWTEGTSTGTGQGGAASVGEATWTQRVFGSEAWVNPGGDFDSMASATTNVGLAEGGPAFSFTDGTLVADVQSWLDDPGTNFGWALLGDETGFQTAVRFGSSENATLSLRPELLISYTAAAVPEPGTSAWVLGGAALAVCAWVKRRSSRLHR